MVVAVLGASAKADRYSNRAVCLLMDHGHQVIPVAPGLDILEGLPVIRSPEELIPNQADTVTLYINPSRSIQMADALVKALPRRVIMNPGAENPELAVILRAAGIQVKEACTLVLLNTGEFE